MIHRGGGPWLVAIALALSSAPGSPFRAAEPTAPDEGRRRLMLVGTSHRSVGPSVGRRPDGSDRPVASTAGLMTDIQTRAFRYFWERANAGSGLVTDRAANDGSDRYDVASIAATGFALAALPVGVEHGWVAREAARKRAAATLAFVLTRMPSEAGWMYHFVDVSSGRRVWQSEVSTIDTALLVLGALAAGRYFKGEVLESAQRLYDRIDWDWALTNGGSRRGKLVLGHGWSPERGHLPYDYGSYSEAVLLYLLGLGASKPLPDATWTAWERPGYEYAGIQAIAGGPIFIHQMPFCFFDLRDRRDRLGYDYAVSARAAHAIHRRFSKDRGGECRTYREGLWGLNASDGPAGYRAYGVPGPHDGTVSPTGMASATLWGDESAAEDLLRLYRRHGTRVWGRYGFVNAVNLDRMWFDTDVIGIDLGMALLAIENRRSGLTWKLLSSHPFYARALRAAGLRRTAEPSPRALKAPPGPAGSVR